MISPAQFIPIAEDTGLILPIGEWVLKTACLQAKGWLDYGRKIVIAVNLSARQFQQQDLVSTVSRVLQETNLPPQYLELE
jgi:EAL domain-containing protein (putative c-di-GMP-specific phosphodiesterase class I)